MVGEMMLYTLKELATIKYGKNQKKVQNENGKVPIYGTGGLMGYATESLYDKPSVLIGRKGTIDKVKYVEHPFWTVDTLFYTIVNEKIVIPKYLYYLMSTIDLEKYNEGTTIPSLRTETLNRIELNIPSLDVQSKILSYLNPIDEKIALNERINRNLTQAMSKAKHHCYQPSEAGLRKAA
jgi:type I restriction enzyme S subunit